MNIAQAKEEIKNTVRIYTRKNEDGSLKLMISMVRLRQVRRQILYF